MPDDDRTAEDIDHALYDFGVRSCDRASRKALSRILADDRFTGGDVRFLGERIDEGAASMEETAGRLAGILGDAVLRRPTLEDMRHAETKRQERLARRQARHVPHDRPRSHEPNMPPTDPEIAAAAVEGVSLAQLRRRKWCRYVWHQIAKEGHTAADVAADVDCTVDQVEADAAEYREWLDGHWAGGDKPCEKPD